MAKDHWFPFFVFDWLSSTLIAQMDAEQERGYLRLLCHCWADPNCSLPGDPESLARLSLLNERWFNGGSDVLERAFVPHPTKHERKTNVKLYSEWKKLRGIRRKCREAGVKSGQARRSALNGRSTKPRTECERNANQSQSQSHTKNKRSNASALERMPTSAYPKAFLEFWEAYPRKVGKAKSLKAWVASGKRLREFGLSTAEAIARMHDAAKAFAESPKGRGRFVPHPATWLSEGRYDDDPAEWQRADVAENKPALDPRIFQAS